MIVLASGGTGGHLFPAEALSHVLLERGYAVTLITDGRGTGFAEKNPQVQVLRLDLRRSGRSVAAKVSSAASIAAGTVQAMKYLREVCPVLVVGFGGYPSFPTVIAAEMLGIRTLIHEQNTVGGRANRALGWLADGIATSFPQVQGFRQHKLIYVGHPVRSEFEALRGREYHASTGDEPINLLVTGGSQGASIFAEIVPAAIERLPDELRRRVNVTQQCRPDDLAGVTGRYQAMGVKAETASFLSDLPARLASTHLAIGRSGASTVIENAMAGCPTLFVPLPSSLTGEQASNAWFMETAGAAIMVKQSSFTAEYLATRLESLLTDPERLAHMAAAARDAGKPHAAENLADAVGDAIEGRSPQEREAA
jgi:UDP-N-acetylglucosamine--N-acetylmuramyl-(pentapeptide) pyrophosphoryl-undecaprenol N-acetylglucosamine transferase